MVGSSALFQSGRFKAEDKPLTGKWRLEATWTSKQQRDYIQERKGSVHMVWGTPAAPGAA